MLGEIDVDMVIITAMDKEFGWLSEVFEQLKDPKKLIRLGNRNYYLVDIKSTDRNCMIKVAFLSAEGMGRVSAALAARDAIYDLSPDYVILSGIAAASPIDSTISLGDILYSESIVDYEIQKIPDEGEPQIRAADYICPFELISVCNSLKKTQDWVDELDTKYKSQAPAKYRKSVAHLVKVACGDKIIANKKWRDILLSQLGQTRKNLSAIEMESGGISYAIYRTPDELKPLFIMIKGACDYADYQKDDVAQRFAGLASGIFLKHFINDFILDNKEKFGISNEAMGTFECISDVVKRSIILKPNENILALKDKFPHDLFLGWRDSMVDGCIEVFYCPTSKNRYGGFGKEKIICKTHDDMEWPNNFALKDKDKKLAKLSIGLLGDNTFEGWLKREQAGVFSGRIRILMNAPYDPTLDRKDLILHFGNSDFFTVKAITEISKGEREGKIKRFKLDDIFPERWAYGGNLFGTNCIPYHVSSQAIIICREPYTDNHYIILSSSNPSQSTLVSGWSATMAEQMKAPPLAGGQTPWWTDYVRAHGIKTESDPAPEYDTDIVECLIRGLKEEFGILPREHCQSEPKLLCACIEEDMYFITFIFFVKVVLPLTTLYDHWYQAPDRNEMGLLAAYQIEGIDKNGKDINKYEAIANLLSKNIFDGKKYLINATSDRELVGKWHPTARKRIFVGAYHMWGSKVAECIKIS